VTGHGLAELCDIGSGYEGATITDKYDSLNTLVL
jgi:hypothetical protein